MSKFTHLHLHTKYSALDGAIKLDELADRLIELGMDSCAITDHGAMYGVVDFYKTLNAKGIKPIIGSEFYISPSDRLKKDYPRGTQSSYHLVLLAENNIGLQNLYKLSSIGFLEGFYYKPRIDKEVLEKYSEGIIALSACLGGEIPRTIFSQNYEAARDMAIEYNRIMGDGNFFLELQENGIAEQTIVNKQLIAISKETGIPLVATADCHYLNQEDHEFHNVLMRIQLSNRFGSKATDTLDENGNVDTTDKDIAEYSSELYVKSPEKMINDFHYIPVAVENTVKIAERCNVKIEFGKLHLPIFISDDGEDPETHIRRLAAEGLNKRLEIVDPSEFEKYRTRLDIELKVIIDKGFDSYFLIVQDFVSHALKIGTAVGPGRGSGAGSLVSYSLGITDIDPLKYNLLFERFLNPERESMPDFDIDFCIKGRAEVIDYVTQKYGTDRVSQIVTFSTLKPRNAIRDIGRALGLSVAEYDKLSKLIPFGTPTFEKAFDSDPSLERTFNEIDRTGQVLKYAKKIEGLIRQVGLHAAGVIIADDKIDNYAPLAKGPNKEVIIQFEKDTAEKVGLIKFDFLGLKNLTTIDNAIRRIREEVDKDFDIKNIPLDSKAVYNMLSRGESVGVFQLESDGMRNLLEKLKPTVFEDIIAANALYRPGPINSGMLDDFVERKHGRQKIVYLFDEIKPYLEETYGVIVYQEQVMQIARTIGGYSLGAADTLRRAMGKKKAEIMALEKTKFLNGKEDENIIGVKTLGFDMKKAEELFDLMAQFAEYGFNKSHSAAYSLIAYQTAYLKKHYPNQYIPALLTSDIDASDDLIRHLKDAETLGYNILIPSINHSFIDFRYDEKEHGMRFALSAIKNVGANIIDSYVTEREKNGKFTSIYEMCKRLDSKALNKKTVESLILAGALDCFNKFRSQHLSIYEECLQGANHTAKLRAKGISTIEDFIETDENEVEFYNEIDEMPKKELLEKERELTGIYISDHPLKELEPIISLISENFLSIKSYAHDTAVLITGMIDSVQIKMTKKMQKMAVVRLLGLDSDIELIFFSRQFSKYQNLLEKNELLTVKGRVSNNSDNVSSRGTVLVDEILDIGDAIEKELGAVSINFNLQKSDTDSNKLNTVLAEHPGKMPVKLFIEEKDKFSTILALPTKYNIKPSFELISSLKSLNGFKSLTPIHKSDKLFFNKVVDIEDALAMED